MIVIRMNKYVIILDKVEKMVKWKIYFVKLVKKFFIILIKNNIY